MSEPSGTAATHTLWAMDMDDHGQAVRAHRIVKKTGNGLSQVRIAACGHKFTAKNHTEGWWNVPNGDLPLANVALIHCGLLP